MGKYNVKCETKSGKTVCVVRIGEQKVPGSPDFPTKELAEAWEKLREKRDLEAAAERDDYSR